jgi:hypothetical protein
MPFDFAAIKAQARRIVHGTFGVPAEYSYDGGDPVSLRVRWHTKMTAVGDMNGDGYAMTLDGIERLIFNADELAEKNLTIQRGGLVKLTAPQFGGHTLVIDTRENYSGPAEEIWHVGTHNGTQPS